MPKYRGLDRRRRLDRDRAGGYTSLFIRALDEGGTIWDSSEDYPTLDDALRALDDGIKVWVDENL